MAETLHKSCSLIRRWKDKYDWEYRIEAYDNDIEEQTHKKKKKLIADTKTRQQQIALRLEVKALKALESLDPESLSAKDIQTMLRLATDIEQRIILSQEEEEEKQTDGVNIINDIPMTVGPMNTGTAVFRALGEAEEDSRDTGETEDKRGKEE